MNHPKFSRRDALRAAAGVPLLLATGARAGLKEDFAAALAENPRLLAFASARALEFAAPLTPLRGRLPAELTGILWRNGPAEHERFGHRYGHWFDGDGMIQAFAFNGTGVTHRARILDTPKRRTETGAGRRSLPAFGSVPPDPAPILGPDDMNVANTSVLVHGGRLMALWEGGSALEFDAETLGSRRFVHWREDLAGLPFSAHPKRDADGTVWNIGVATAPRPALLIYRIDPAGRLAGFNHLPTAPLGMVHDFVVTARHLVLLLPPFVVDSGRFSTGTVSFLDAHVWRPELGTRVLVVEKDTLELARQYELPPGFHFHHGNGWEASDGTIRLDLCQAPNPDFVTRDFRAAMQGDWSFASTHPRLRRVDLPPDGAAAIEDAAPGATEFPRIDPRRTARHHRNVFALNGIRAKGDWPLDAVVCVHTEGGAVDRWTYPAHCIPEEHVFVPRGENEGDGWLLGPFLDLDRRTAGLNVFDAAHLADGPLWEGILPYPLPLALHGTFVGS